MPYLPNNANIFGDLMRRPDVAANWFQGAVAPNASNAGIGGFGGFSPDQETMLMGTEATEQPVESVPRTGLFPELLAKAGLISPDIHADVRTQFAEQAILRAAKEREAERRGAALDHYMGVVKEVGGDRAAMIGPSIFQGLVSPEVFEDFKGVPSYADMLDKKLNQQFQQEQQKEDARAALAQTQQEAMMQRTQAVIEGHQGADHEAQNVNAITHAFTGGLVNDSDGFARAMQAYSVTGNLAEAIQEGLHKPKAGPDTESGLGKLWDSIKAGLSGNAPIAPDPKKKAAVLKALGIGG